ncbi:Nif3-like dinuclear metal center hexameric protein [Paradesulfitobacterium ferrireducens]|uniref:Nif3-like dinuclear metal center hexameric protein n=1 Tax=Paradesulfitobacterium ferrireducens TaxID=2816476 RepID=UPI001A8D15F9|nr:Nif3-like dinuclear metal center hexameric protein [Paradesulfitobacterium ferrireducens]
MAATVGSIAQTIEKAAPKQWAEEWDNVGLLVGNMADRVERVLLALDGTLEVVAEAKERNAQMIVAHHPLMFRPLKNLRADNPQAEVPLQLLKHGIAYYAAHTNLDQSRFSASRLLGQSLGLREMDYLAVTGYESLVKLAVFVPAADVEKVRQALVKAGVGESITGGAHSTFYAESFFQSNGEGMFRPLPGAEPALGAIGELTRVAEVKLESILPERLSERAIKALLKAHPYEEPAYDLIPLQNRGQARGYGIIGYLPQAESLGNVWNRLLGLLRDEPWADWVDERPKESPRSEQNPVLVREPKSVNMGKNTETCFSGIRLAGDLAKAVRKVAILNGSGGSFVQKALFQGTDLFIAGDIDHHAALDALQGGMAVADIGHFISERPMVHNLAHYLRSAKALQGVEFIMSKADKSPWLVQTSEKQ